MLAMQAGLSSENLPLEDSSCVHEERASAMEVVGEHDEECSGGCGAKLFPKKNLSW